MVRPYRNISFATAESFRVVLNDGAMVTVRGLETRELRNRLTALERPRERCVFLPGRRNDIFAQIAETMWVIAGRDDLPWLTRYLERAPDFSDDGGATWRGAYGPRLRSWAGGVDQIDAWRQLLITDRASRRAVGMIFDPARDFVESKDIPCNNWLSWIIRDDRLHMNLAIRSNDAMWGFSGVNAFEWSVLQEMLAFWLDSEVGEATFFATSYHLYRRHFERARQITERFFGVSPYDFGIAPPTFQTAWPDFGAALADWFAQEEAVRADPDAALGESLAMSDPFLASALHLLRLKWGAQQWSPDRLAEELARLPENDFTAAAYEFFGRTRPELLQDIPQRGIDAFFAACRAGQKVDTVGLKSALKRLHARKNSSYGGAWKRRGERVSVVPNIARKVDRLENFARTGAELTGETILDTALDLYVYAAKYQLFLAEQMGGDRSLVPANAPEPLTDNDINFEVLVDAANFNGDAAGDMTAAIEQVVGIFADLWPRVEGGAAIEVRTQLADNLTAASVRLVGLVAAAHPHAAADFIRQELRI